MTAAWIPRLQVIACVCGYQSHEGRTAGTSQVSGQRHEGEQRGTASFQDGCADAERAGPHDPHGKAADPASQKAEGRQRGKRDHTIGENAERAA